jgi:hypothetical protein
MGFGTGRYHDSSMRGNHGVLTNMNPITDWLRDPILRRSCLDFDGSNDIVICGNKRINTTFPLFVGGWFYPKTIGNLNNIFCSHSGSTTGGWFFGLGIENAAGNLSWTDNGVTLYASSLIMVANTWQYIAFNWTSATSVTVYLNQSKQTLVTTINGNAVDRFCLGDRYGGASRPGQSRISDCIVCNQNLSETTIARLADPSNVMLDTGGGNYLILPPKRRIFTI